MLQFVLLFFNLLLMRKICLALILSMPILAIAQETPPEEGMGLFEGATNSAKMLSAKHEYNVNNMRGALVLYREIIESEPENAGAHYWTARCHYRLKRYDLAEEYLDKAVGLDPSVEGDVAFFYGEIHHRLAKTGEAISFFCDYLLDQTGVVATSPNSLDDHSIREFLRKIDKRHWNSYEKYMARKHIRQCMFARESMANPVKVKIENMGRALNSRFDDYTPSVSADGNLIIFTSRRSDTKGGEIDEGGDYKFFEDIYFSEWNEEKGEWSGSRGVYGEVNTPTYDAVLSIAPAGDRMFIYKNNRESAGDIFNSTLDPHADEWLAPVKLPKPVNTSYYEGSVSITADGEKLYFISERPEGLGQGDIYVSIKKGEGWSSPKSLGESINTDFDEKFVFIHPNGKTLYFSSNGHQTMGSYDIFKSEYVNGEWGLPVNLGYPINTVNEESTFSMTRDNNTMFLAAEYDDTFGERDIYRIDVSEYNLISEGYERSTFGTVVCTVSEAEGKRIKGAVVEVWDANMDKVLTTTKTDKLGIVRISLPGNKAYNLVFKSKKAEHHEAVDLKLKRSGETLINLDVDL